MVRITPLRGLLMNLAGEIPKGRREYLPPEAAREQLRKLTDQDFGFDVARWREWIKQNRDSIPVKKRGPAE